VMLQSLHQSNESNNDFLLLPATCNKSPCITGKDTNCSPT